MLPMQWLLRLPLFWRNFVLIGFATFGASIFGVYVLEPVFRFFFSDQGSWPLFTGWPGMIALLCSSLLFALSGASVLAFFLNARINSLIWAATALSHGNFELRMPVSHKGKNEFDTLARIINETSIAVERMVGNERKLLADISHELRSPLARMAIAVELLENKRDGEGQRALVRRLAVEVERMSSLITLLLTLARNQAARAGERRLVDVREVVLTVVEDSQFQGLRENKKVDLELEKELFVMGSNLLLQSMLGNILSNAIFHTPPGSRVDIAGRREGDDIIVTIRDYGLGVPEELLEDIFRAFYRVDSSRSRSSGGAGLGLALALEVALNHSGMISARNAQPGLEIVVTLPAVEPDSHEEGAVTV